MQQPPACRTAQENYPRDKWVLSLLTQSAWALSSQPANIKRLLSSLLSPHCLPLPRPLSWDQPSS